MSPGNRFPDASAGCDLGIEIAGQVDRAPSESPREVAEAEGCPGLS